MEKDGANILLWIALIPLLVANQRGVADHVSWTNVNQFGGCRTRKLFFK
jgi:hypothetical protein